MSKVDLYVDPVCPFAWIAYRWLCEVEAQRNIELTVRIMSLAILNDGREGRVPEAERGLDSAWRPVRVAAAVDEHLEQAGLRGYYETFGRLFHVERLRPRDKVIRRALAAVDMTHLLEVADTGQYDEAVRKSHEAGLQPVGLDVGTPAIHVDGVAFFGPILTAIPRGQDAVDMFDGTLLIARNPHFSELKRTRGSILTYD
jgi:predicted DsbA family dithiol-disulfide isomerase